MNKFYKVRKGFKYTGSEPISNLDYWYGPWDRVEDFGKALLNIPDTQEVTLDSIISLLNEIDLLTQTRKITPGFTIGVYDNPGNKNESNVTEYLWQKDESSGNIIKYNFVEKIEKYELKLDIFEATLQGNNVILHYKFSGKGLSPFVSISGTSIQNKLKSFNTDYYEDPILLKEPGIYTYRISITDGIGTPFVLGQAESDTVTISYGDILVSSDLSQIRDLPVNEYNKYNENLAIKLNIKYNSDNVSEVKFYLNNHLIEENITPIYSKWISLYEWLNSSGNDFNNGKNKIYIKYKDNTTEEYISYDIYEFDVLNFGLFGIQIKNISESAYLNTTLGFYIKVLYGGDDPNVVSDPVIRKNIKVYLTDYLDLNNTVIENTTLEFSPTVNVDAFVEYKINLNLTLGKYNLWVELVSDSTVNTKAQLNLQNLNVSPNPFGSIYFNKYKNNVIPKRYNNDSFFTLSNDFPTESGKSWTWNLNDPETILRCKKCSLFNFDICYSTPLNGTNDTVITIIGSNRTIKINKLSIVSMQTSSDKGTNIFYDNIYGSNDDQRQEIQKEIYIPINENGDVHIGYGYNRKCGNNSYYDCIFINGEIVFSSTRRDEEISDSDIQIIFSNSLVVSEFCFSSNYFNDNYYYDCVSADGEIGLENYNLLENSTYDVFYNNWRTTLINTVEDNNPLSEFKLVPIVNNDNDTFWNSLETALTTKGSPLYIKPINKLKNFIVFGDICKETKPGVENSKSLFGFAKEDKESLGENGKPKSLDKKYAVVCRYKLENYGLDITDNGITYKKLCIVQVQGTSTIAYPVPNFLFTFIKYTYDQINEQYNFELDDSIPITYLKPDLTKNIDSDNFITELTITGEINLVAKADSMDSAHLNNTPTCIYLNSLLTTLKLDNDFSSFLKFSNNQDEYDAIVGYPILLKISNNETNSFSDIINFENVTFRSIGTFMFNTGKSAKCLGMDSDDNIYSLEGQSNQIDLRLGSPGLFMYPNDVETLQQAMDLVQEGSNKWNDLNNAKTVREAFDKVDLIINNGIVDLNNLQESNDITNNHKKIISNYLISNNSFESRNNKMDDDDLRITEDDTTQEKINNKWNKLKPFLIMWLFVNKASDSIFKSNFGRIFNLDYAIIYYIHLVLFALVDNLGKNMMLDMDNSGNRQWYIRFYDLDSELGLNNAGSEVVPTYACISEEHFKERYNRSYVPAGLYTDTNTMYNSKESLLWTKFWRNFKLEVISYYEDLRDKKYITSEKIINIGYKLINKLISKEQYNIDFCIKHYGTKYTHLNRGGRFNNYKEWIKRRFMYVDSYFEYLTHYQNNQLTGYDFKIGPTLIPTFYESGYESQARTFYGLFESNPLPSTMSQGKTVMLDVVPESILYIYPIWEQFLSNIRDFVNLLNYFGGYDDNNYEQKIKNLKNILTLEFTQGVLENGDMIIPSNIEKLTLNNISGGNHTIDFELAINLEELHISDCEFNTLSVSNLKLLKKLTIANSRINQISLLDLNLEEFSIDINTTINTLSITGSLTKNKIVDLSGIGANTNLNIIISIESNSIEEIRLDYLYDINGELYTVYDNYEIINSTNFSDRVNGNVYNSYINGNSINITNRNGKYLNKKVPKVTSLNLLECTNLKTFSCIGSDITELKLPTSIKNLNVLFCTKLTKINLPEQDLEAQFNFSGFQDLSSKEFFLFYKEYSPANPRQNLPSILYYLLNKISSTFSLMGCTAVEHINNLANLKNSFSGNYFVSGCTKLIDFNNCDITFKSLVKSFFMTEKLENIDFGNSNSQFKIELSELEQNLVVDDSEDESEIVTISSSLYGAFMGSNIAKGNMFNSLLELFGNLEIDGSGIFAGSPIYNDIGTLSEPLVIRWSNCNMSFGSCIYSNFDLKDYENFCSTTLLYSKLFTGNSRPNISAYIKLPNTTSVYRMFRNQNIKIMNSNVFENNNSLTSALGFLDGTKLETLIDFRNCTNLINVSICYHNTLILVSNNINENNGNRLLLPNSIRNAYNMLKGVNLAGIDVKNIFSVINRTPTNTADFSGCFRNTSCNCSGSPFGDNFNPSRTVDISSMFYNGTSTKGIISSYSWINNKMITAETCHNGSTAEIITVGGVFEGNELRNFPSVVNNDGDNQNRMFKNCEITSLEGESHYYIESDLNFNENSRFSFTINSKNASGIFEESILRIQDHPDYQMLINIDSGVENLSRAFMNTSSKIKVKFLGTRSNIENLDWTFGVNKLSNISPHEGDINCNYYIEQEYPNNLVNLRSANHIFLSSLITDINNPNIYLLFKGCTKLNNFRGAFKNCVYFTNYNQNNDSYCLDLSDCINISNLYESFCNSGIWKLPKLPVLNNANELYRTFRNITLRGNNDIYISGNGITVLNETFAETSNVNIPDDNTDPVELDFKINLVTNNLSNINVIVTNPRASVTVDSNVVNFYAYLNLGNSGSTLEVNGSGFIYCLDNLWNELIHLHRTKKGLGQYVYEYDPSIITVTKKNS